MWQYGELWAGNQSSYNMTVAALASAQAVLASADTPPVSDLLSIQSGVGIVRIAGPLIPGNAGWMGMFGLTGYGDVRDAVIEAATNPEVKSILLYINSGGGAVDGCVDCASMIAQVSAVKPTLTFADGSFGSAAYWLGSQAEAILISSTTLAGSIGVILKHMEMSKMLAAEGVTATVIRSGKYKQLANQLEPLSEIAQAELQQMSDDIAEVFLNTVASARGGTAKAIDAKMGQGREFVGQRAVSVGLADGIATYEGAISAAKALQPVDNTLPAKQNMRQSTGASMALTKKTLNAEQIAAIASGAVIEASDAQQQAETTADEAAAAAATAAAAAQAASEGQPDAAAIAVAATAATAAAEAATAAAAAAATAGTAGAAAVQAESELVKFLRTELSTANSTLIAKEVELVGLRAEATTARETHPKLLEIARGAVGKMKIALGGTAAAAEAMSAAEVITAHAETSDLFMAKFKVGGAAATGASDATKPPKTTAANVHPLFQALATQSNVKTGN